MPIHGFFSNTPQLQNTCYKCGLQKDAATAKMTPCGLGNRKILIIGDAPDSTDDMHGSPFSGDVGLFLANELQNYGISMYDDTWLINAVNCKLPKNRSPSLKEIACCRSHVRSFITQLQPKFIWLCGKAAIQHMYHGRFSQLDESRWHRLCIADRETNAWIIAMHPPAFTLNAQYDQNKRCVFEQDIAFVVDCLKKPRPTFEDPFKYITQLTQYDTIISYLKHLLLKASRNPLTLAFDFETSSLRPYKDNQKIWSCSICSHNKESVAFPIEYTGHFTDAQIQTLKKMLAFIMQNKYIQKIAHNLQFEDLWVRKHLKCTVENWQWCTMNAAHVLDCRKYLCSLKFQAYIHFGIEGYEKEAKPYMQKQNAIGNNALDTFPLHSLLKYNAIDSLATYWLYQKQIETFTETQMRAYKTITLPGICALNDATHCGIFTDSNMYESTKHDLQKKLDALEKRLLRSPIAIKFRKRMGYPLQFTQKDFSIKDLRIIIYDILKTPQTKKTPGGLLSVDNEVIESIDHVWMQYLLKRRKMYKLLNTYLKNFTKEIDHNNRMHPFFFLHTTRTYRGSSEGPNFQNIPNRDELSKAATRKGIIPSEGRRIVTADYGSQEVRVAAILSQDEKLKWYCSQDHSDMHLDIGSKIWSVDPSLISKEIRFYCKGGFVFAQIYGSYYVACAQKLWDTCINLPLKNDVILRNHLENTGIISKQRTRMTRMKLFGKTQAISYPFAEFIDHVKSIETWFWNMFFGLRNWQNTMIDTYRTHGHVTMPFGFKRTGVLSDNMIFNSAIQGTAFHILMWAYIELNKQCKCNWDTHLIGQIHDEILFDCDPNEFQTVINETEYVMTEAIRNAHSWINVPLLCEPESTKINESWYYKKPLIKNKEGVWEFTL